MSLASDIAHLKEWRRARSNAVAITPEDRERFNWYSSSCPCGVPAGDCTEHPRARTAQRPPDGDWRIWVYTGGRGTGKTRSGAEWLLDRIKRGICRNGLAIGATAQDLRDVLVEGPSGFLSVSPPWDRPTYEPSKRRLTWRNGARVTLLSGEEPNRCRGLNVDTLLCDELPHWSYARETFDLAMLALRAGPDPRCMVSTTPKRVDVLLRILSEKTTVATRETTHSNRLHLAPEFIDEITSLYSGTRFARQEIEGELLDTVEGAWFGRFDQSTHVQPIAILPGTPAMVSIDAGTSRTTAAVFFQVQRIDQFRMRFLIHDAYLEKDRYSAENAAAILSQFNERFPDLSPHAVYIDIASSQKTSIGPAALEEYQAVFGERKVVPVWTRSVTDDLDMIEAALDRGDVVIHPRAQSLIDALKNYSRQQRGGQWLDVPAASQSPWEDSVDALRYGVKSLMPPRKPGPDLRLVRVKDVF